MTDLATIDDARGRPIEFRSTGDLSVDWAERMITLVAMPYDEDAAVVVHGRPVTESCAPGAFDGVERRANRVKVNRDHDYQRTIGRAVGLHPSRAEGLVAELRIAKTALGDETLALADDHSLEASVGFAILPGGERWLEGRAGAGWSGCSSTTSRWSPRARTTPRCSTCGRCSSPRWSGWRHRRSTRCSPGGGR
jgi:hypothetical protein